ncbi:MAG: hypothetical protein HY894_02425 [Deltaproteobacteria bacterium]|nr:hypothetical protein [Deltaproteobacteria bacterium]
MKIKAELFKYLAPAVARDVKLKLISGEAPAGMVPEDRLTALFALTHERDAAVAEAAKKAFSELTNGFIIDALGSPLDPLVVKKTVDERGENEAVLTMAALNQGIDDATLCAVAERCHEDLLNVMAEDREVFAGRPGLMEAVRKNPSVTSLVLDKFEGKAVAAAPEAAPGTGAAAAPAEDKDELSEEDKKVVKRISGKKNDDEVNIIKLIRKLTVSQKVKLAMAGNKSARELLVKETNKLVYSAVLKNPRITEDEILRLASTKGTSEEILRQISRNREWAKNYSIRHGIVTNPKTPTTISVKMLDSLNDVDVLKLTKSKSVPSIVAGAARRRMEAKAKRK